MAITNIIIAIFIFLFLISGVIVLQLFLSKGKNRWAGLILPAIPFLYSLFMVLSIAAFSTLSTGELSSEAIDMETGEIIGRTAVVVAASSSSNIPFLITAAYIFILTNIPTAILVGIYIACRKSLKRNREIEKMNIQDLE